jgi:uroporphyrinogen-III decarboxylase
MDVLIEASIAYLVAQLRAGAEVVQLFESWAQNLDEVAFETQVIEPNRRIVDGVRAAVPRAAIIGFPRAAPGMLGRYAAATGVDMVGLDQAVARLFALREPAAFAGLMDVLVESSVAYLVAQLRAGAEVVQLFESWAQNLDEGAFETQVIEPNRRIVDGVRSAVPGAAIIGFPRAAPGMLGRYAAATGVDMVGLDQAVPLQFANELVPAGVGVQGNLDPLRLAAGGDQMRRRADAIIAAFAERPHVFNLGHGVVPDTPVEHVAALVEHLKRS